MAGVISSHSRQSLPLRAGTIALLVVNILVALGSGIAIRSHWPQDMSCVAGQQMSDLLWCESNSKGQEILHAWITTDHSLTRLDAHLQGDSKLIFWYVASGIVIGVAFGFTLMVCGYGKRMFCFALIPSIFIIAGGVTDRYFENAYLAELGRIAQRVDDQQRLPSSPIDSQVAQQLDAIRNSAMLKIILLCLGLYGNLLTFIAAMSAPWRRCWGSHLPADRKDFLSAMQAEALDLGQINKPVDADVARGDEPFVRKQSDDMFGLALSGGGIRSAIFALGIITRLRTLGLLQHVDYLSTVSGGGYIGGWLTRCRAHDPETLKASSVPTDQIEAPSIRHLRQFSNFLVPRWGFLESETWFAIAAVVGGLVPALLISTSVVVCLQYVWQGLAYVTSGPEITPTIEGLLTGLVTFLLIVFVQWLMTTRARETKIAQELRWQCLTILLCLALVAAGAAGWLQTTMIESWRTRGVAGAVAQDSDSWSRWLKFIGVREPDLSLATRPRAAAPKNPAAQAQTTEAAPRPNSWQLPHFFLGVSWLAGGAVIGALRLLVVACCAAPPMTARGQKLLIYSRLIESILGSLLLAGLGWIVAALLWQIGISLSQWDDRGVYFPLAGSISSATIFAWFRNELFGMFRQEHSSGKLQAIRPYIPMLLAYAAVLLFYIASAVLMLIWVDTLPRYLLGNLSLSLFILVLANFLPPDRFGLHEFYRGRIARAFLGGARKPDTASHATRERVVPRTAEQLGDDLLCSKLPKGKPYHLICTAANDVAGDPLVNLNRGARSATVSRHGVMIGDKLLEPGELRFSSALTASAAAFNSQMGSHSVSFGPAVAFLMCALNLRLGMWTYHPYADTHKKPLFPGLLRFREMFNQTRAYEREDFVHLSDGGHFENLGLYELVRRRCRYIIVSDAGADPNVKFEDFGNAVRKVREDFGADIEIDLAPLIPDKDGWSRQHVAVGTIRYDSNAKDFDVGVLVYFKPALTGDEPIDVLNYKSLNPTFPHETTLDQFYDEAQWESYRSLGSHAAFQAFRYLDGEIAQTTALDKPQAAADSQSTKRFVNGVFSRARKNWYPTPPNFNARMIELNARFVAFERRLAAEAPLAFVCEIYPELDSLETAESNAGSTNPPPRLVHIVLEMLQLIEDTWLLTELDRNYTHPMMVGWINTFNRWTHAKTFRKWWPFLAPLFTPGMRQFALNHLDVPRYVRTGESARDRLQLCVDASAAIRTLPSEFWGEAVRPLDHNEKLFVFSIAAPELNEQVPVAYLIARTVKHATKAEHTLRWNTRDFKTRPGLWGSGISTEFLTGLIETKKLADVETVTKLEVTLALDDGQTHAGRGTGHRRERNDLYIFYKSMKFHEGPQTTDTDKELMLVLDL